MAKKKTEKRRRDYRFFPQSNANPWVVRAIGGVGAILLGAGAYEQFLASGAAWKYTPHLLGIGALAFALSIWFGTSGDPMLRVGDAGVGIDRGNVERIPWYAVTEIAFDPKLEGIFVTGKDDTGKKTRIVAKLKSQPQAAAWIVKQGKDRIPKLVHVTSSAAEKLPEPRANAGDVVLLEPLQVVGRKCAATGKIIAYEPDARVCPRCERVYYKKSVPKKCECGGRLDMLRDPKFIEEDEEEDEEETASESASESESASASESASESESESESASASTHDDEEESASEEETT